MSKLSLAEIIAAKKAQAALSKAETQPTPIEPIIPLAVNPTIILEEKQTAKTFALNITLNKEQLLAKELAFNGKSFVLTGAAGTGKTTAQREIAKSLLEQGCLKSHDFRIQGSNGLR